jgi:hypothetical protein
MGQAAAIIFKSTSALVSVGVSQARDDVGLLKNLKREGGRRSSAHRSGTEHTRHTTTTKTSRLANN